MHVADAFLELAPCCHCLSLSVLRRAQCRLMWFVSIKLIVAREFHDLDVSIIEGAYEEMRVE